MRTSLLMLSLLFLGTGSEWSCLKMQTALLMLSLLFLVADCKWSCSKNADCIADGDAACSFSQDVSGRPCDMQTALLMVMLPVPSHRMQVVLLDKCRLPC
jgi:hypothetical protein